MKKAFLLACFAMLLILPSACSSDKTPVAGAALSAESATIFAESASMLAKNAAATTKGATDETNPAIPPTDAAATPAIIGTPSTSSGSSEATTPKVSEPFDYTYNSHILLPQFESALSPEQKTVALRMIDAIELGATTLKAGELNGNKESFAAVWYVVRLSAPLSALIDDSSFQVTGNSISFSYTLSESAYAQAVSQWHTLISSIITQNISKGSSDVQIALALYQYLAQHITYRDEAIKDLNLRARLNVYDSLVNGTGVCYQYSLAFAYLAEQCGLYCYVAEIDGNPDRHAWDIVQLNGVFYHVDPTFASSLSDQSSLTYFGMNDRTRKETLEGYDFTGDWYIHTCQDDTSRIIAPKCLHQFQLRTAAGS